MGACTARYFVETRDDGNALSLRASLRLHDPQRVAVSEHSLLQLVILAGAVERLWHEIEVLLPVKGSHSTESLEETVLASEFVAAGKVVDLLEAPQVIVDVRFNDAG